MYISVYLFYNTVTCIPEQATATLPQKERHKISPDKQANKVNKMGDIDRKFRSSALLVIPPACFYGWKETRIVPIFDRKYNSMNNNIAGFFICVIEITQQNNKQISQAIIIMFLEQYAK